MHGVILSALQRRKSPVVQASYATDLSPEWQRVIHVGPQRQYTTIEQGIAAAAADSVDGRVTTNTYAGVYGGGWFNAIPRIARARTVIVLDPGTYQIDGTYAGINGVDVVGITGNRDDVTVIGGLGYAFNITNDFYTAHITYRIPKRDIGGKSYAIHFTGMGLDLPSNNILENVRVIDEDSSRPGGNIGWDGPDNSYMLWSDCLFEGVRGDVLHGDLTPEGIRCVAVNTHFLNDSPMSRVNHRWLIGCSDSSGPIPDQYEGPDTGTVTTNIPPPPLVTNGTTHPEKWEPSTAATGAMVLRPTMTQPADLGPVSLEPGRIYYIPLEVSTAGSVNRVEASMTTLAGKVALGVFGGGNTAGAKPSQPGIFQKAQQASSAPSATAPSGHWQAPYVTHQHGLWAAMVVTDESARVSGSAALSSDVPCYRSADTGHADIPGFPTAVELVPKGVTVPWLTAHVV